MDDFQCTLVSFTLLLSMTNRRFVEVSVSVDLIISTKPDKQFFHLRFPPSLVNIQFGVSSLSGIPASLLTIINSSCASYHSFKILSAIAALS